MVGEEGGRPEATAMLRTAEGNRFKGDVCGYREGMLLLDTSRDGEKETVVAG